MTKSTFKKYYKRNLISAFSLGITLTVIRILGGHQTQAILVIVFLVALCVAALIISYFNYRFYEKSIPKIVSELLDKSPLSNFKSIGFVKEGKDKLEGTINGYKIILSPFPNIQTEKQLAILIPLQIREGLDNYFTKYNDNFRFCLSGEQITAEAILKDYDTKFTYSDIFTLIEKTTLSLKEKKIEPVEISNT